MTRLESTGASLRVLDAAPYGRELRSISLLLEIYTTKWHNYDSIYVVVTSFFLADFRLWLLIHDANIYDHVLGITSIIFRFFLIVNDLWTAVVTKYQNILFILFVSIVFVFCFCLPNMMCLFVIFFQIFYCCFKI